MFVLDTDLVTFVVAETKYLILQIKEGKVYVSPEFVRGFSPLKADFKAGWHGGGVEQRTNSPWQSRQEAEAGNL